MADPVITGRPRLSERQGDLFAGHPRSFHLPRPGDDRIGVVDVGSNSVRMVVFEDGRRCPSVVFNEKILCGLGAELSKTGALAPEGCERAMRALHRFVALAPSLRVGALAGVATAAVREARDGPAFRDRVEAETGIRLKIATGADEARLAAQGVIFGNPAAEGLVIDLGGASMEFCPIAKGQPGLGITAPLGPQRLGPLDQPGDVRPAIDMVLGPLAEKFGAAGRHLHLVGGAWRALARVQIHRSGYPLNILHEYAFTPEDGHVTARRILNEGEAIYGETPGLPSGRIANLPHAALLLEAVIDHFKPELLSISGFGLREGMCYEYLPGTLRRQDPLLSTCAGQERTRARAFGFGAELAEWVLPVLDAGHEEARIIRAACHMADVSWRAHPDYRPTACMEAVTRVNVSSAGHLGRVFLGAILLYRYRSGRKALDGHPEMALLDADRRDRAAAVGALLRLGCTIAGAAPGPLLQVPITVEKGVLTLRPARAARILMGEEVEKRLAQAARALGLDAEQLAQD